MAPVVFMLIFGLIAGCFLAYQNSALHDGATAGARMASIESALRGAGQRSTYCESDTPSSIEAAIAQASPLLTVNPAPLCTIPGNPGELTQGSVPGHRRRQHRGALRARLQRQQRHPTVTVKLQYSTKGLVAPVGLTYNLSATSTVPGPSVVP